MIINYQNSDFKASFFSAKSINLPVRPEIIFIGRSNVGKSSMINKLLNRKSIARVSVTPGKTTAINFYNIDDKIFFVDLPGYGYAKRSKIERYSWGNLIGEYFMEKRDARLILFLIDIRHEPTSDDFLMYKYLLEQTSLFCIIASKADKLSEKEANQKTDALSKMFGIKVIPFSSKTGKGVIEIKQIIEDITEV